MNELVEKPLESPFLVETSKEFGLNPFLGEMECAFKKCCKKWKKKGKHCKKCPDE